MGAFVTKMSASRKCLQARKHLPIGGKRHHINQSQMIWQTTLRNRGNCGRDQGGRVTAAVTVIVTAINSEFSELRDL